MKKKNLIFSRFIGRTGRFSMDLQVRGKKGLVLPLSAARLSEESLQRESLFMASTSDRIKFESIFLSNLFFFDTFFSIALQKLNLNQFPKDVSREKCLICSGNIPSVCVN